VVILTMFRDNQGGGGRGNWNPGPREEHPATCSDCGKETMVPFKPTPGKPVYCRDCYSKRRANRY